MNTSSHIPVLLNEVLEAMTPVAGEIYVDGTFGAGGYSRALLEAAECTVYAIDRDPSVAVFAEALALAFPGRFFWLLGSFGDMLDLLVSKGVEKVNGIVLDIGVSSMQIDTPERGFSFRFDGPLDMRMSGQGESAADLVNGAEEGALADILYHYGEERRSRAIARAIALERAKAPIETTARLASIVRRVLGRGDGIDPATRTFQALRIRVNDELGELERALEAGERLLAPSGRLVVVTFHSLEDRIVKQFFQSRSGETRGGSRHLPPFGPTQTEAGGRPPAFFLPKRKAISASPSEASANSRARSARLRLAVRREAV